MNVRIYERVKRDDSYGSPLCDLCVKPLTTGTELLLCGCLSRLIYCALLTHFIGARHVLKYDTLYSKRVQTIIVGFRPRSSLKGCPHGRGKIEA